MNPDTISENPYYYVNESFPLFDDNNNNNNNNFSTNNYFEDQFNIITNTTTINSEIFFNTSSSNNIASKPVIIEWDSIKWLLTMYSIIFLLATLGNSLVILTLVQNKRMRTITNVYLLNLAISDLFLGVFCMPFTLVGMILRNFMFGEIMCKLLPYLQGEHLLFFSRVSYILFLTSSQWKITVNPLLSFVTVCFSNLINNNNEKTCSQL